jgi:two-component system sensor histidine kinase DesK
MRVLAAYVVLLTTFTLGSLLGGQVYGQIHTPHRDLGHILVGALATAAVLAVYPRLLWVALMRRVGLRHRVAVAGLVLVCFGLVMVLGQSWGMALTAPAGLFAVVFTPRTGSVAAAAMAVAAVTFGIVMDWPLIPTLFVAGYILATTFSGAVTVWFCHVVEELRQARAELAGAAVGEERLRFARDLHDVLGHSLQAVALRAELAERMIDRDPGRVAQELAEIQGIARGAVKDVREIVRGYRATSLRTELDGMTAVLHAAGIRCETPVIPPGLPVHVHETLGWVARESVTNVPRHSTATWGLLTVRADDGRVHLEIANDGAGRLLGGAPGSGLAGLAERIANVGGRFTAALAGDGTFRVAAEVPLATGGEA